MESQHTIGYGFRYMTDNCPPAYVILSIQLVVGVFLQTMLTGIVLAKVLRPKKRKQEMRFSRIAVIGPLDEHDRRPALMIRLADVQEKLFLAESHVRLYMASSRINNNTYSLMPNFLFQRGDRELIGVKDMNVGYDSGWDRVLLLWPIIVRHVIDESSPLYGLTRESLLSAEFELIMTVEGIVEATGMTFQARTSFLPDEILWGHKVLDFDVAPVETEELDDELAHHNNASGFM
ncbi:inward rectifier potassium channel 2 domain protein [Ancylostoma ceylanicum]|uniref:Inward rectifier potassium channel 2 domain protein n=1 Tax=Ancylostoma ceylanicum TaxID=53326 RepID=A0A0D6LFG1_9BILA|nr:inward rectifier potassium channel 2 domain protein [Ancylostoma ceylanicum]